jgi:ribonucleotide reductase alpha subunit
MSNGQKKYISDDRDVDNHGNIEYLCNLYGSEFEKRYIELEQLGMAKHTIPARDLFVNIAVSLIETGFPYIIFKDAANKKSNQKNLGTIESSNLCTEIIEYSSADEHAVCTLASVCLPEFITDEQSPDIIKDGDVNPEWIDIRKKQRFGYIPKNAKFDRVSFMTVVCRIVRNLDTIIDINKYPTIYSEVSNKRHRPLGIGVQGLADMYVKSRLPFDSSGATKLNKLVFETMYYSAMCESVQISYELRKQNVASLLKNGFVDVIVDYKVKRTVSEEKKIVGSRVTLEDVVHESVSPITVRVTDAKGLDYSGAYTTFNTSPLSQGKFQFNLWEDVITEQNDLLLKSIDELKKNAVTGFITYCSSGINS